VSDKNNISKDFSDIVHTGPDTIGGRYLRSFWQPVFLSHQLAPGRAKPLQIMNENFTLYRGQDGLAQVIAPYCPHRGTQLSTGWVEGNAIRCFYHGWKFGSDGRCLEAPAEREGSTANVKIRSYPTQEYKGLIFAFLGDGEAPAFPRYSDLDDDGILEASEYRRDCNFFNNIENQCDPVHVAFTHRASSFTEGGLVGVPQVSAEETSWGLAVAARREGGGVRVTQIGMPNLIHIRMSPASAGSEWGDLFAWRIPIDDVSHKSFNVVLHRVRGEAAKEFAEKRASSLDSAQAIQDIGAAFRRGELSHEDIKDHPDLIGIQDDIVQVGQGAVANRAGERLSRSDVGVALIRKLWLRELRALESGAPLKSWQWSPALSATAGTSVAA